MVRAQDGFSSFPIVFVINATKNPNSFQKRIAVPRIAASAFLDFPIHGGVCLLPVCRCLTLEISSPLLPMDLFLCFALLLLLLGDGIPVSGEVHQYQCKCRIKKGDEIKETPKMKVLRLRLVRERGDTSHSSSATAAPRLVAEGARHKTQQ
jgi:hypothetical protein